MIRFEKFTLDNGLRVILNQHPKTPIITMNTLYNVGSKHEHPDRTGFAHLFEHLMFGGSLNVEDYDKALDRVGGDNNAFTNTDITNYYINVPKINMETAFWLESDRMLNLNFNPKVLDVQKQVVVEEFKQNYINKPYGDTFALVRDLTYKTHPYRWATIGKEVSHIEQATMEDVKSFYQKYYNPNNAIICISGDLELNQAKDMMNKWYGDIENKSDVQQIEFNEPLQIEKRVKTVERDVPLDVIYITYKICKRHHPDFMALDLWSDVLSSGDSSRLYQRLVKQRKLFHSLDAYLSGEVEEGMFIIEGKLNDKTTFQQAEQAIREELDRIFHEGIKEEELKKVKNKVESNFIFGQINSLNRAYLLCFFELLSNAEDVNEQVKQYLNVSEQDIRESVKKYLNENQSSVLYYKKKNKNGK